MSNTPRTDAEADNASLCDQCVPAEFSRQIERELADANEREEKVKTMLLDPATVHINMLRGTIAKLDWPTLEHIHGNHPLRAQRDALLEALEELHAAMVRYDGDVDGEAPSEHHQMMSRVRSAIALAKGGGQ